jgi:hypothetical protein
VSNTDVILFQELGALRILYNESFVETSIQSAIEKSPSPQFGESWSFGTINPGAVL